MPGIYQSKIVQAIRGYYGKMLYDLTSFPTVSSHVGALALEMHKGLSPERPFLYHEINNYHQQYLGKPIDILMGISFTLEDCREAQAHAYGFESWQQLEINGEIFYNTTFERAVNAIVEGEITLLQELLDSDPNLVKQRSSYAHNATLLHYTGSNGVEIWRQIVPSNLPDIITLLLQRGADKTAKMNVYGGKYDTLALLESSGHPYAAGMIDQLREALS